MYQNRFRDNEEYKAKIDAHRPLSLDAIKQIRNYFKISFTYASNAIEGNTLSLSETKVIIEDGITIGGKTVKEHMEALGGSQAYDLLFDLAKENEINEKSILDLHKMLYQRIDDKNAGKYRTCNVLITGSEFELPDYNDVPVLMEQFIATISNKRANSHPVEFAAWLHERFVSIHPFIDGNGRCARLLMNLALLQAGYNIITISPVVRNDYICALQEAQIQGNLQSFINFISEMVLESQKEYLKIIDRF